MKLEGRFRRGDHIPSRTSYSAENHFTVECIKHMSNILLNYNYSKKVNNNGVFIKNYYIL